jgi:hypothetical protein
MNIRQWCIATILAATAWAFLPASSQAQYYGHGWGGPGVSIGVGYGGWGYGGWRYAGWGAAGPGWGNPGGYVGPYPYFGGVQPPYPGSPYVYYNNTVYSSGPSVASSQPIVGTATSHRSFYPSSGVVTQGGSSTLVVNVPDNAQLFWNGQTQMVGAGASRRFTMQPTVTTQRIEARWTGPDGKTVTQTRDVNARPNETVTIDFTALSNGITNGVNNNTNGVNTNGGSGSPRQKNATCL